MTAPTKHTLDRRSVLKGAVAAATLQLAPPFILKARGETPLIPHEARGRFGE